MPPLNTKQAMQAANQHHQSGQFPQAEALCRQILEQNPNHAEALHLLGILAYQAGRKDSAVELIRKAIASKPNAPEAHYNLGVALKDLGQLDEAIAAYRQAISLKPYFAEAYGNLGVALQAKGQFDEAIAMQRQALTLKANWPEAYSNLGNALKDTGQLDEAIAAQRQAIALKPGFAEAYSNLGNALQAKGQLDEAITACRRAIALNPNLSEAYGILGKALQAKGQFDQAITVYRQAIACNPKLSEMHYHLGHALHASKQLDEAAAAYRQAIALNPNHAEAHYSLGVVLKDQGQPDAAITAYRQALAINPHLTQAYSNLGVDLCDQGQLDEAIVAYRQALALDPDNVRIHSNLVYTLYYHPAYDAHAIAEEHRQWNLRHAEPFQMFIDPHPNARLPERRLRVGYVSPDFRNHCQTLFTIPLLAHHDHDAFEMFCYASVAQPDDRTRRIAGHADVWRDVRMLDDVALGEQIRADGIDILVDLTMHMADGRPLLFARKPAPVQVAWLAYPGTTGMDAMDYRLTDPYLDPLEPGVDEQYVEKSIRLPATFWCYDLLEEAPPEAGPLPALANGYVTFGCLNNFSKVNEVVLRLWAKVMAGVADSRLVILAEAGRHRDRTLTLLEGLGISRQRVRFEAKRPRLEYLKLYQQIDIGLDTLPYNGHTTSLDGYFMGVPVVTLVGQTVVGRAGVSQLTNLGLPELIGRTEEEYVAIAQGLAQDSERLALLRAGLRARMQASPLMDGAAFARGVEAAYRQMWRQWCAQAPALR